MNLSNAELHVAVWALRIAADVASTSAYNMDVANQPRIAEQFRKQRAEAIALADKIELHN